MKLIHAVYEQGVFRPTESVDLPDGCEVEFEPRVASTRDDAASLDGIYEILSRRFDSGTPDLAARHNEHQP